MTKTMDNLSTAQATDRMSEAEGFTIVQRNQRSPKVHKYPHSNSCNTEKSKSGRDTITVMGSRELLNEKLAELGYRRSVACRRCFAYNEEEDVYEPVLELPDPEVDELLDKYDESIRSAKGPLTVEYAQGDQG